MMNRQQQALLLPLTSLVLRNNHFFSLLSSISHPSTHNTHVYRVSRQAGARMSDFNYDEVDPAGTGAAPASNGDYAPAGEEEEQFNVRDLPARALCPNLAAAVPVASHHFILYIHTYNRSCCPLLLLLLLLLGTHSRAPPLVSRSIHQ
jgi:hypothetical protein